MRTWRPVALGRRGAVASNHPLATRAGIDVLARGGNAFDAAVAVAAVIAVVEPALNGVGGDGFYLLHEGATGRSTCVHAVGAERARGDAFGLWRPHPEPRPDRSDDAGSGDGVGAHRDALRHEAHDRALCGRDRLRARGVPRGPRVRSRCDAHGCRC